MSAPFDYSELLAVANDLLAEFGRPMTLTRASRTPAAEDVWLSQQGDPAAAAAQSISLIGVNTSLTRDEKAFETVERKVAVLFIQASPDFPEQVGPDWELVDGTRTYQTLSSTPIQPGDTLLLYRLLVEQ